MLETHHLLVIWQSLGVMAICALAFGVLQQRMSDTPKRAVVLGSVFGCGAVMSMVVPIVFAEGLIMDARTILVGFAALFGGVPAAIISAAFAIAYRFWVGGIGAPIGAAGIVVVAVMGLLWRRQRRFLQSGRASIASFSLFGLATSSHLLLLLALPIPDPLSYLRDAWLIMTPVFIAGSVVMGLMMQREYNLMLREQALAREALTDPLTGLANRRAFDGLFHREVVAAQGETPGPSLLLVDVDHFKQVNDTFGHEKGDLALQEITRVLRAMVREGDTVARYGGEEFCLLLPRTVQKDALIIAERVRETLARSSISLGEQSLRLTVSVGVASASAPGVQAQELFAAADRALYRAKRLGRNRVLADDGKKRKPEGRALPVLRAEPAMKPEILSS
ncbi:MAG TPA: diguanylate cyclase [Aurantimonas sp.]|nr:diguanylate cyclase [Aurantimonas sp.]